MPKLQGSVHYIYHSLLYLMNINCFKKWLSSGLVGWLYNKSSLVWLFNAKIYLGGTQKRNWTHSSFVMVIQSSLMSHYSMPRYPFLLADLIFFLDWLGNIVQYLFCKRFFFYCLFSDGPGLNEQWFSFFHSLVNCMITRFTIDSWVLNFTVILY